MRYRRRRAKSVPSPPSPLPQCSQLCNLLVSKLDLSRRVLLGFAMIHHCPHQHQQPSRRGPTSIESISPHSVVSRVALSRASYLESSHTVGACLDHQAVRQAPPCGKRPFPPC
ncbi:hypothetical protein ElyMa_003419300 [Elysia marginata]|uniref:Uncharacterized protein n=1 Tax=Elysia marginata TaxID=1093978 RepID=A0AAV4JP50_9GAST|nr:hypothetical protein ElyMa_003419300 [Elysia marginata]